MFTQFKAKSSGLRVRVDLAKVQSIQELGSESTSGAELTFDNGATLVVEESYQTVSNRANKGAAVDAEPASAVTGL